MLYIKNYSRDNTWRGVDCVGYFKDKQCTILHREDGPAIEWKDGSKEWLINGEYHKEDGPAISYLKGIEYYYLNGVQYSKREYWSVVALGAFI